MNTINQFEEIYTSKPEVLSKAPGRLEVLGNHTDYNEGFVLSVAVNFGTEIAFSKNNGNTCEVFSPAINDGLRTFDLDDITEPAEGKDWTNYIRGVVRELQKRDYDIGAFKALINSNMPLSAGMSSSASIEMALVCGLCKLFNLDIPLKEKAQIGQGCENNYIGANTGLLDQLSSLSGKTGQLVLSEYRDLTVKHTPFPSGLSLVVVNTAVTHDLSCEYNERRQMCEEACETLKTVYPEIKALRDVTSQNLEEQKNILSKNAYKRAKHVIGENERVFKANEFLSERDLEGFGQLLFESHESSRLFFENSCEELDFLVDAAKESDLCLGARLSGGGFGGISVHLVEEENTEKYVDYIQTKFAEKFSFTPKTYICFSSDGASVDKL